MNCQHVSLRREEEEARREDRRTQERVHQSLPQQALNYLKVLKTIHTYVEDFNAVIGRQA